MSKALDGRVALVTGGGQGVGQGIVRALADAGAKIVIAQRGVEQGEQEARFVIERYGAESLFVRADVSRADQVESMVKAALGG